MQIIDHIADIADRYDHFIIDVWGVLHNGECPYGDAIHMVETLTGQGKKVVLLSNSPMRSSHVSGQLENHYGLSKDHYIDVVTSGEATHRYLLKQPKGMNVFYVGRDYFFQSIQDMVEDGHLNVTKDIDQADVILAAGTGSLKADVSEDMDMLKAGVTKGIKLICSNPDLVVQVGENLYPCPGQWAAKYQELGGEVLYFGKPHALVYENCLKILGAPSKDSVLAIGDSLHTDITGAHNLAIDSLFNIIGIHTQEVTCKETDQLDQVKLEDLMRDYTAKPDWVMKGVRW